VGDRAETTHPTEETTQPAETPQAPQPAGNVETGDTGVYLYAVGSAAGSGPASLAGVLGTPVRVLEESASDLVAYVSTVPLTEFGEEALRRNLEDLPWLETIARAHHEVLTAIADAGPLLPVRLVTVYRGDEQVREMLRDRAGEFAGLLVRMSGRKEWGVKVYAVGQATADRPDSAAERRADEETERPGTAYLKRRGKTLRGRETAWRRAVDRAGQIDAVLSRIAVATRHHRAQDPRLSGRADLMVLNSAYLVDEGRTGDFTATAVAMREDDLDVQLTGPWPPYSFTISDPGGQTGPATGDAR
jgi:hypothetical protein